MEDKKYYFIGNDSDGNYYFLESASFDCDWYWSFGHIVVSDSPVVSNYFEATHLDYLLDYTFTPESFKRVFVKTSMSDEYIWKFLDLMKSFYTISNYHRLLCQGDSHIASDVGSDKYIKNEDEYIRIKDKVLPTLFFEVYSLLEG